MTSAPPPGYPPPPTYPPGYGPALGYPPPRRNTGVVVAAVVALVAVLAVAGVAFVLTRGHHSDNGGPNQTHGSYTGPLTINGFRYVNACAALTYQQEVAIFGTLGSTVTVDETYAESIAPAPKGGYLAPDSRCDRGPGDDAKGASVDIRLTEWDNTRVARLDSFQQRTGSALPGASDARIVKDRGARVIAGHNNVQIDIEAYTAANTPPPDSQMLAALQQVIKSIDAPTSAATQPATTLKTVGGKSADACAVFTSGDYQQVTKIALDNSQVSRTYTLGKVDPEFGPRNRCQRETLSDTNGTAPAGTRIIQGTFSPDLSVTALGSTTAARRYINAVFADGTQRLSGIGDLAFYLADPSVPRIRVAVGQFVFELGVGVTNGTSHWPPSQFQSYLEGLAKAIVGRLR